MCLTFIKILLFLCTYGGAVLSRLNDLRATAVIFSFLYVYVFSRTVFPYLCFVLCVINDNISYIYLCSLLCVFYLLSNNLFWMISTFVSYYLPTLRCCTICPRGFMPNITGRSGLVVTRLPAAREDPGSRRAAGKSLCFHENHCDTQLWARAAH